MTSKSTQKFFSKNNLLHCRKHAQPLVSMREHIEKIEDKLILAGFAPGSTGPEKVDLRGIRKSLVINA